MAWYGRVTHLAVLALAATFAASYAHAANSGRAAPPPLVLSPNLTEPWLLQLQQPQQRVVRRAKPQRQRGFASLFAPRNTTRAQPTQQQRATRPAPQRQIAPQFLPTIVPYNGAHAPGTIVINTNERFLYLVQHDGTARRYGVGVGKPGFEWGGTHKVTRKAEWPDWRPPAAMRKRRPELPVFMAGGPDNPLGARALYLGSTLYRIHGSNQPWTIGHAVSSGCIRMRNEDVIDLYERVGVGTKVHVI
ncbi:lipoprotein-anchoring transpeptidase ErfK/SrfK [Roseibium hamelinense]|uniref:Lipoprotein-anchoring transpeptidase ErfK/SrfK n=1 Tax=Roseibium hamelinense TaxID=150831 RepID=A0A562T2U5_9HYPH|nr:L,D-transpeptidase [Roseibium hamelinense]MTI43354.1 L,D-transpeptidase [Roseibium hamelinense]TWI87554.1 lipoprotein-anchoring transpeptidase ErfK/SrfK [Roseibium hamelinense]